MPVNQPPTSQTAEGHMPPHPTSVSTFDRNGAVVPGNAADGISDADSISSEGDELRHSFHRGSSTSSSGEGKQNGLPGENKDSLSDLVSKGVGRGESWRCSILFAFTCCDRLG